MAAGADPVRQGFVQSLSHPGGNFTGLSWAETETMVKLPWVRVSLLIRSILTIE